MLTSSHLCFSSVFFPYATTSDSLNIRLMGGRQSAWFYSGRVEVSHTNGSWGTICDDGFDNREALVICKMFGFHHGIARSHAYYGQGTGHIFMDDVDCDGNETSIMDCPYRSWGRTIFSHTQDAGVDCFPDGDVCKYTTKIMFLATECCPGGQKQAFIFRNIADFPINPDRNTLKHNHILIFFSSYLIKNCFKFSFQL